jgi:hypothetical protein
MSDASNIDQIVQDILADMPLKEKAAIANLNEDVMHRIWEVLQETHRVRCVK